MYPLFLVLGVALVILSPLALELYLTLRQTRDSYREPRASYRPARRPASTKAPVIAWPSPRLH